MCTKPHGYYLVPNTCNPTGFTRTYAATVSQHQVLNLVMGINISVQAFYLPNKHRQNLTVIVTAPVRQIVTKTNENGELVATGVKFEYDGKTHQATAIREIILSAG